MNSIEIYFMIILLIINTDDWETAWSEQLAKRARELNNNSSLNVVKRDNSSFTHSIHRFIEVALVADKKFIEFWSNKDIERYLLTIMNMVADYYHDASTGNQIDVVVVRMIYLEAEEKEVDLTITRSADQTLESFAAWASRINPKDHMHPLHHDVGLLITRYPYIYFLLLSIIYMIIELFKIQGMICAPVRMDVVY